MALRRTVYALLLIGAVCSFIITDNAVTLFFLACLVVLPCVSLLMLFFASRIVKFELELKESCMRGQALKLTMSVGVSPRFLAGHAKVIAEIENSTFGKTEKKVFSFYDLSDTPGDYDYVSADSGRICVRVKGVTLIDIFGIFSLTVKAPKYAESIVSPVLYDDIDVNVGQNRIDKLFGETVLPKKGGDVTETFGIRDYAAGDALNSVHWKLSGKFDSLKVKEFGSTDDNRILILVDMSRIKYGAEAGDGQLNAVLDVAISVSDAFKSARYQHSVGWFIDGEFVITDVCDNDTFIGMVHKLMSIKVDGGNSESLFYLSRRPECSAFTKLIFVSSSVHAEELKEYAKSNVTAISVGIDNFGEEDYGIVRIIGMQTDNIREALARCEL